MKLFIKTKNEYLKSLYENHEHFHPGDSGIDLFCPEDIIVSPGSTVKIDLQIQCEGFMNKNSDNVNV